MSQAALFAEYERGEAGTLDATSDEWFTPKWILDILPPIRFDPCYSPSSNVAPDFWLDTRRGHDGLTQAWGGAADLWKPDGIAFCNPPYSDCASWVAKCQQESLALPRPVVALVPCYAGDKYWHRHVWGKAAWVAIIEGRVRFDTPLGPAKDSASFTSALVCWAQPEAAIQVAREISRLRCERQVYRGLWTVPASLSFTGTLDAVAELK